MNAKIEKAFEYFDAYNQQDPNTFVWEGNTHPQEYFFSLQLYKWVQILAPEASDELLLASRCQHIGRWEKPRSLYPDGKVGYLTWRKDLSFYHTKIASDILLKVGFEDTLINRVSQIIQKQKIKADAEVQTIENALCLVFLEFQYEEFYQKHEPDKVVLILRKSLLKMDAHGHSFALKLNFSTNGMALINKALVLI